MAANSFLSFILKIKKIPFYSGYQPAQLSYLHISELSLQRLVTQHDVTQHSVENISSEAGFEQVYRTYFKPLYAYARTVVRDSDTAEEIVQQVFFKLWVKERYPRHPGDDPRLPVPLCFPR
ncbi:MAG: hypothetical protein LRY55_07465 [Leadbetterella sp.]|nr:hypothetical protein [Leadbetterella sp.]